MILSTHPLWKGCMVSRSVYSLLYPITVAYYSCIICVCICLYTMDLFNTIESEINNWSEKNELKIEKIWPYRPNVGPWFCSDYATVVHPGVIYSLLSIWRRRPASHLRDSTTKWPYWAAGVVREEASRWQHQGWEDTKMPSSNNNSVPYLCELLRSK